jgi:hypothetical protein
MAAVSVSWLQVVNVRFQHMVIACWTNWECRVSTEAVEKRAIGGGRRAVFAGDDGQGAG